MYDNLDNAIQKLKGTFCYYDGRAVYVKDITVKSVDPKNPGKWLMSAFIHYMENNPQHGFWCDLTDPKFQFMEFNTGYMNTNGYALWYYRIPVKQWKQGLHQNQVGIRDKSGLSNYHTYNNFGCNDCTAAMMEGRYPSLKEAVELLNHQGILKVAFHKDFAIFKDGFRKDLVLEHKGYPAAFESFDKSFKCNDQMAYLKESIAEMNIKVA